MGAVTEHVSFTAVIKAEWLRLASTVARDQLRLETLDRLLRLYEPQTAMAAAADRDDDFERITNPEAPKPLPDVADDFAAAIVRPVGAKTSDQEPLSNGSGEVQDECAIHLPARTREESRERQTAGENPASKPEASLPEPMEPEGTAAVETGKPAGEGDGTPAAPLTKKERVARTHDEHPDWTIAKIAADLNLTRDAVSAHLSALGIKLGHKGTPRKRAEGELSVREKVLALHAEHPDWYQKQIADALGIGTGSVSNAVKGLGVAFPKSPSSLPKPDSQRARVTAYLDDHPGATAKEVSTATGIPESNVRMLAFVNHLDLGKLTPEENRAAKRDGGLKAVQSQHPDFLKDRIVTCNREHPDWNSHQIAEALDTTPGKVSAYKSKYGIPVPARRSDEPKFVPEVKTKPAPVVPVTASPEPEPEPAPLPFTAGDQDEEPVHPTVAKFGSPNAKWFRLRRADGMWLHLSGTGFTADKNNGWIGKIGQLRAIRSNPRYPDAKGLQIVGITQVAK